MKFIIFAIFTLGLVLNATAASPSGVVCTNTKGVRLSFALNKSMGDATTFYGLNTGDDAINAGYVAFENILKNSTNCNDLNDYTVTKNVMGPQYICGGEMFVWGVYGQIIVSEGGLEVFTKQLAPNFGWSCVTN